MTTIAPPPTPVSELRWLTDAYMQTQKLRISIGNRLDAVERGADEAPVTRSVSKLYLDLKDGERAIFQDMKQALEGHPAWPWLTCVKGIGPTLATKLLGLIGEIEGFHTVSKLWRFAGYAVIDGQCERPVKGQKLAYSKRLKTAVYLCAESFLKCGSPYRAIYDSARQKYEREKPDWTPKHRHLAAMRKMSKMFLSHLWQVWREAEGLPTRAPYSHEYGGHSQLTDPWDYVEPR